MAEEGRPAAATAERIPERSRRYLAEGRLRIESVTEETIRASFIAETGTLDLGFDLDRGWWCSDDPEGLCVHLGSLMLVTDVPGYRRGAGAEPPPRTVAPLPRGAGSRTSWGIVALALFLALAVLVAALLLTRGEGGTSPGGGGGNAGLAAKLREANAEAARLKLRLGDARSDLAQTRQKLTATMQDLETARHQLSAVRAALAQARAQIEHLKSQIGGGGQPGGGGGRTFVISYRVRTGDTLWRLAEFFYGSGRLYPLIVDANPALRANPDLLNIGQLVKIPVGTTVPGPPGGAAIPPK